MTEMLKRVLSFEIKEVSPRVLEFIGSTEDKDRMGDIIMADGWQLKQYKKNPVFLWSHHYDEPPIGKAVKVWAEDGKLKFHIQFATKDEYEFADTIYKLYMGGYLRASSVGFIALESEPLETKEDEDTMFAHPATRFLKQELLELSGCPVPANPFALAEAKAKGLITSVEEFAAKSPGWAMVDSETAKLLKGAEKPYPNEHACRLKDPGQYERFARKNCEQKHEGKCIDVIYGIKEGKSEIQALRYKKEVWTETEAKSHCKSREGTFEAASSEESNSAATTATPVTVGVVPQKREVSQAALADELDFLLVSLNEVGINESNKQSSWSLVRAIMRLAGDDIPVDIAEKIGAVLNKVNRERLEKIQSLAQEVLDSASKPEEPEKVADDIDVAKVIGDSVQSVIDQAKGKLGRR